MREHRTRGAIQAQCRSTPYRAQRHSGIRDRHTYHNGEVSNHVYGIAIGVDPSIHTCCGCSPPWTDDPLCAQEVSSIFERMQMPECWVRQFERFGFYWLGRDTLQDTMHFEFLADPDPVMPTAGTAPTRLAPIGTPWPTPVPARAPPRHRPRAAADAEAVGRTARPTVRGAGSASGRGRHAKVLPRVDGSVPA